MRNGGRSATNSSSCLPNYQLNIFLSLVGAVLIEIFIVLWHIAMTLGLTSGHLLCTNMVILVKPKINYSLFISFRGNAVANVKNTIELWSLKSVVYRSDVLSSCQTGSCLILTVSNISAKSWNALTCTWHRIIGFSIFSSILAFFGRNFQLSH